MENNRERPRLRLRLTDSDLNNRTPVSRITINDSNQSYLNEARVRLDSEPIFQQRQRRSNYINNNNLMINENEINRLSSLPEETENRLDQVVNNNSNDSYNSVFHGYRSGRVAAALMRQSMTNYLNIETPSYNPTIEGQYENLFTNLLDDLRESQSRRLDRFNLPDSTVDLHSTIQNSSDRIASSLEEINSLNQEIENRVNEVEEDHNSGFFNYLKKLLGSKLPYIIGFFLGLFGLIAIFLFLLVILIIKLNERNQALSIQLISNLFNSLNNGNTPQPNINVTTNVSNSSALAEGLRTFNSIFQKVSDFVSSIHDKFKK